MKNKFFLNTVLILNTLSLGQYVSATEVHCKAEAWNTLQNTVKLVEGQLEVQPKYIRYKLLEGPEGTEEHEVLVPFLDGESGASFSNTVIFKDYLVVFDNLAQKPRIIDLKTGTSIVKEIIGNLYSYWNLTSGSPVHLSIDSKRDKIRIYTVSGIFVESIYLPNR